MNGPIVLRPEIDPRNIRPGCFAILALGDARPLLHFADHSAAGPVSLTMRLSFEGAAGAARDDETLISLTLNGAPRGALELLPPENGYNAVADISGANCVALTKWLYDIFDLSLNCTPMSLEEGAFGSDASDQPGYETAVIEASITTSLLHHVRSLSNHRRIAMTQIEAIRYLEV